MSLSCQEVGPLLATWVDGEIGSVERARVDAHLEACGACAAQAARDRTARELLRQHRTALLSDTAPAALRAKVVSDAMAARSGPALSGWRRMPIWVAATLVLAFSGMTLHVATGRSTTLLAAQLAVDHVKCQFIEGNHADVNARDVQHRLAERYGFHARVPPSSPAERLRLIGARRCLTGEGTNAHLLYRVDDHAVSLYLLPNEARKEASVRVLGRNAVVWSRDNGTYVLVADSGTADLAGVARYMQRATE